MLLQSLERKKTEVEQLSKEFESKIRAKEVQRVSVQVIYAAKHYNYNCERAGGH